MISRLQITALVVIAALAWAIMLLVRGEAISLGHFAPLGVVVGVLVGVCTAFNLWLWRLSWLHGWFVKRPNLSGTWVVTIRSNWTDPTTGESPPPIRCFYGIEQTFATLKMHLVTPESESWLVASEFRDSPKTKGSQLFGLYTNQPKGTLRGVRSEIHFGAFCFDLHGVGYRPEKLAGEYWTDRSTTGRMEGLRVSDDIHTTYEAAVRAADARSGGGDRADEAGGAPV